MPDKDEYLEDPSWLAGGGVDQGINYCRACAEKEREKHGPECVVDGGWPQEYDSPPQCEECDAPLGAIIRDDAGTEINTEAEWLAYVEALEA